MHSLSLCWHSSHLSLKQYLKHPSHFTRDAHFETQVTHTHTKNNSCWRVSLFAWVWCVCRNTRVENCCPLREQVFSLAAPSFVIDGSNGRSLQDKLFCTLHVYSVTLSHIVYRYLELFSSSSCVHLQVASLTSLCSRCTHSYSHLFNGSFDNHHDSPLKSRLLHAPLLLLAGSLSPVDTVNRSVISRYQLFMHTWTRTDGDRVHWPRLRREQKEQKNMHFLLLLLFFMDACKELNRDPSMSLRVCLLRLLSFFYSASLAASQSGQWPRWDWSNQFPFSILLRFLLLLLLLLLLSTCTPLLLNLYSSSAAPFFSQPHHLSDLTQVDHEVVPISRGARCFSSLSLQEAKHTSTLTGRSARWPF